MKAYSNVARAIASALIAAGAVANAQQKDVLPPAKVAPPPLNSNAAQNKPAEKEKRGKLHLNETRYDGKTKTYSGVNFIYTQDDITATGNSAKYREDVETLEAEGKIVIDTEKAHITGNKAVVDDSAKKKIAIITENVIVQVKPKKRAEEPQKPDGKDGKKGSATEERERGVTIYCDKVENEYKKKYVKMFGNLTFKQKVKKKDGVEVERVLFAEHAEYDGKTDVVKLFSPVRGEDTDGQKVKFEKDVLVGTKEGEETLESSGRMELDIIRHDDEDDDKTPAKEPKKEDKPAPANPATPPKKTKR